MALRWRETASVNSARSHGDENVPSRVFDDLSSVTQATTLHAHIRPRPERKPQKQKSMSLR
jgi:hypothetical protein